jgi:uncharacterized membrane protein
MRRIAEILSLAALAVLFSAAALAVYGPHHLPAIIPTHFNAAGQPEGWGPSRTLLLLPAISAVLYLLMTWVARHPASFNFPVRATPRNRQRLEALALSMIAWLKAEVVCIFAWVEWSAIQAARHPEQRISPLLMPLLVALVFATVIGHVAAIFRAAHTALQR